MDDGPITYPAITAAETVEHLARDRLIARSSIATDDPDAKKALLEIYEEQKPLRVNDAIYLIESVNEIENGFVEFRLKRSETSFIALRSPRIGE